MSTNRRPRVWPTGKDSNARARFVLFGLGALFARRSLRSVLSNWLPAERRGVIMSNHKGKRGFRVEPFSGNRRWVAAASAVNRRQSTFHLVTEADISEARRLIARHREQTGERLSLTAYVVACLAQTLDEFPRFNAFRRGRRLILLDEVTISVLYEREMEGERVPEPVGLRAVNRKSYREIHEALRAAQATSSDRLGVASGVEWVRFIPSFLLTTFIRLASRSIRMQKRFGVVGVTAIGMFGGGALWPVPLTSASVTVAVGSIVKRCAWIDGEIEEREHLCLTASFQHDLIDGAPAARFVARFAERLSGAELLRKMGDDLSAVPGGTMLG